MTMDYNTLISGLQQIPEKFLVFPAKGAATLYKGWNNKETVLPRKDLIELLTNPSKGFNAYSVALGTKSGGLICVDIDGFGAYSKYKEIFGVEPNSNPSTVKTTSGTPGHQAEYYYCPEEFWGKIEKKKIDCGIGEDNKSHLLECRWDGQLQHLPPSFHEKSGGHYFYLEGCSFLEVEIAIAPQSLLDAMKKKEEKKERKEENRQEVLLKDDLSPIDFSNFNNFNNISLRDIINTTCRDLLISGKSEGGRNHAAIKLAIELIGAEDAAKRLGIYLNDNAQQLFNEFCSRCNPPIKESESINVWNSANKKPRTSSLTDEAIMNCVKAKQYKENKYFQGSKSGYKSGYRNNPDSFSGSDDSSSNSNSNPNSANNKEELSLDQVLRADIQAILDKKTNKISDIEFALSGLAAKYRKSSKEIKDLYNLLSSEDTDIEDIQSVRKDLEDQQRHGSKRLDHVDHFLPKDLQVIKDTCRYLGFYPEAAILAIYTTVASLLKPTTNLLVRKKGGFRVPPILFSCMIAPSGSKKTPFLNKMSNYPLRNIQKIINEDYEIKMAEWNSLSEEQKKGQTPPLRRVTKLGAGSTIEGLEDVCEKGNAGNGVLIVYDELKAHICPRVYNSGGKGDEEWWLTAYNGMIFPRARRGAKESGNIIGKTEGTPVGINIIGGIQPEVLQKAFKEKGADDSNGYFARFSIVNQPLVMGSLEPDFEEDYESTGEEDPEISVLTRLYKEVDRLPAMNFSFDKEAKDLFHERIYKMFEGEIKMDETMPSAIKTQMNKMVGKVSTFIMLHHIINHLSNEIAKQNENPNYRITLPPLKIGASSVALGISWVRYQIGQVYSLHSTLDPDSETTLLNKILAVSSVEGRTPGFYKSNVHYLRANKVSNEDIKRMLIQLQTLGYGHCEIKGNKVKFFLHKEKLNIDELVNKADKADKADKTEDIEDREVEVSAPENGLCDNIENVDSVDSVDSEISESPEVSEVPESLDKEEVEVIEEIIEEIIEEVIEDNKPSVFIKADEATLANLPDLNISLQEKYKDSTGPVVGDKVFFDDDEWVAVLMNELIDISFPAKAHLFNESDKQRVVFTRFIDNEIFTFEDGCLIVLESFIKD